MAHNHVALLSQGFDALRDRDVEAFTRLTDPECVWVPPAEWPESAPIHGHKAIWAFIVDMDEAWQEGSYELDDAIESGDDTLVAHVVRSLRGKASGVGTDFEYWNVVSFRDGRMIRSLWFVDRRSAIEAAKGSRPKG